MQLGLEPQLDYQVVAQLPRIATQNLTYGSWMRMVTGFLAPPGAEIITSSTWASSPRKIRRAGPILPKPTDFAVLKFEFWPDTWWGCQTGDGMRPEVQLLFFQTSRPKLRRPQKPVLEELRPSWKGWRDRHHCGESTPAEPRTMGQS